MRRRAACLVAATCFLLPLGGSAAAQRTISLNRPTGEIGGDFDGTWIDFPATTGLAKRNFKEWIRLRFAGVVFHPRLFNFQIGLRPTIAQTTWSGFPESPSGGADGLDFNGGAHLLAGAPVSLSVRGMRSTLDRRERFGRETDVLRSELAAVFRYRNPYMPSYLEYNDRFRDVTYQAGSDASIRHAQNTRILRLVARSSKTRVQLERFWFDDRMADRDFTTNRAVANHRLRWGKRSHLRSAFQYSNRARYGERDRIQWSQEAHLQHTWGLSSDYQYSLFSVTTPGDDSRGRSGQAWVTYQALPVLELGAELYGQTRFFTAGRQALYWTKPRVTFSTDLPLNGYLRLSGSVGYQWQNQRPNEDGVAAVVNERHLVDESSRFVLNEAFADPASVFITSADETILFQDGLDYLLVDTEPLIEVVALPGGRIAIGDTVLVDYRFEILPDVGSNALVTEYGATVRLSVVTLFHQRTMRDESDGAVTATLPALLNYDDMTTRITIGLPLPIGHVRLSAQQNQRRAAGFFDFTRYIVRGTVSLGLTRTLRGRLGGSGDFRRGGDRPFDLVSANTGLDWNVGRSLRLRVKATAWHWTEDGREERFVGFGGSGECRIGRLTLRAQYDLATWDNGFDRTQNRLVMQLVRSL